jgi:hypothetical protein
MIMYCVTPFIWNSGRTKRQPLEKINNFQGLLLGRQGWVGKGKKDFLICYTHYYYCCTTVHLLKSIKHYRTKVNKCKYLKCYWKGLMILALNAGCYKIIWLYCKCIKQFHWRRLKKKVTLEVSRVCKTKGTTHAKVLYLRQ